MKRFGLMIATAAMCLPSLAFADPRGYLRTYDGPPLPREDVAILSVTTFLASTGGQSCSPETYLLRFDAKPVTGPVVDVELLPGTHEIEVAVGRFGRLTSKGSQTVTFDAEAGHIYGVDCAWAPTANARTGTWRATVIDLTGKLENPCGESGGFKCNYKYNISVEKLLLKGINGGFAHERASYAAQKDKEK